MTLHCRKTSGIHMLIFIFGLFILVIKKCCDCVSSAFPYECLEYGTFICVTRTNNFNLKFHIAAQYSYLYAIFIVISFDNTYVMKIVYRV